MAASSHPRWVVSALSLGLVVCLTVSAFGMQAFLKANAAKKWPTVPGTIVQSEIKWSYDYQASIGYEYVVDGKKYHSDFVGVQRTSSKRRNDLEPLIAKYPLGQQIPVHYNPSDPTDARLEPGLSIGNWLIVFVPFVFAMAAGADLIRKYCQRRANIRKIGLPADLSAEI